MLRVCPNRQKLKNYRIKETYVSYNRVSYIENSAESNLPKQSNLKWSWVTLLKVNRWGVPSSTQNLQLRTANCFRKVFWLIPLTIGGEQYYSLHSALSVWSLKSRNFGYFFSSIPLLFGDRTIFPLSPNTKAQNSQLPTLFPGKNVHMRWHQRDASVTLEIWTQSGVIDS